MTNIDFSQRHRDRQPHAVPIVDGEIWLWREWLPKSAALQLCEALSRELAWEQSVIRIHGREVLIPRLNAWYGDEGAAYRYSGRLFDPRPWTPVLRNLKEMVQETTHDEFNSVLANLYRDGNDSVGWHSDDETELGPSPIIASLSLGSERKFSLKHKRHKDIPRIDMMLPSGSLLVMRQNTQHFWTHQVSKTKASVGPRVNLTYRLVKQMRPAQE